MSRVYQIVVRVPDGVSSNDMVKAVSNFISCFCDTPPHTAGQKEHNVYVATFKWPDGTRGVAAVNVHNLTEEQVETLSAFMREYKANACILCAADLPAHPHNTLPIVDGKCCDACNQLHVLPFRMFLAMQRVANDN